MSRDQVGEMCEFQVNLMLCTVRLLTIDDDLPVYMRTWLCYVKCSFQMSFDMRWRIFKLQGQPNRVW